MATAAPSSRPAWYGPVPFGGKPPPMPAGWNPNSLPNWNKGFWQPNPFYNPNVPASQSWMPAQAWQQQPGANFNPYKRVVKPPSAEYMAAPLSDNPLGLSNMIPREELYGKENDSGSAHTPWFWNPTRLEDDDEQEGIITAVYRDQAGNKIGRESRGPAPTRHSSLDNHPVDSRPSSSSQARQSSEPTIHRSSSSASAQVHNYPVRHSSEPPPETSSARRRSSSSERPSSSSHRRDRSQDRSRSSYGPGPTPPDSASSTTSFNRPRHHEDFTGHFPLRPTFSTAIIRTPEHYSHSPRRSNSTSSTTSTFSTTSPATSGATSRTSASPAQTHFPRSSSSSIDSLSQRLNQLSAGEVARASEVSSVVMSGASGSNVFTDEPSQMLSPLMMNTPKPLPTRPLGRNHTAPTPLDSIPEASPIPPAQPPPQSISSRHVSPISSRHVSPKASIAHEAHVSPPNSASVTWHRHSDPHEVPRVSPPENANRHFHEQRPSPNAATNNARQYQQEAHASSSTGARYHHEPQVSPNTASSSRYSRDAQAHPSQPNSANSTRTRHLGSSSTSGPSTPAKTSPKRRRGFWNRRGDHLTSTGKIVYAPPDRAFPEELRGYPGDKEGYMDEFGIIMGYLPSRQELEESLPRHGRSPLRPYDSFVVYE